MDEQSHGQKQMEQVDRKLKNGLMNKMEHQQRPYASFVESVRKQTHMLKKKEDIDTHQDLQNKLMAQKDADRILIPNAILPEI